jgi:hypothetical protein
MRRLLVTLLALAVCVGSTAQAQLAFPFPDQPEPDLGKRPQCTSAYVRSIERQTAAMEKLRAAGPEVMSQLCSLIELGNAWLGSELSDETRKQLKEMLGFDGDLAHLAAQCRVGQGNLERDLMSRLGYLRSELVRCNDTI